MKTKTIKIKTKGMGPFTLFLGLGSIVLWIVVVVLLVGMIGRPSEIKSLWFAWLAMIGIGLLTSNHIVWEIFGSVQITIESDRLNLININSLFKNEVDIPLTDFNRLTYHEEDTFGTGGIFGFSSGNIILDYNNGQRRFGKDLSKRESLKTINRIEKEIKNYAQQQINPRRH
jgi:hypothetical protein